ncbi:MAG: 4-(cytidine 5'-diphospho)-2-C-methyl-D-erythritol kinase [Clostridia bacterium]|nr:4-(cytidine 5'-diphospho)-2-C-methyl-D-erythritol kinase [Clostridia bacterium]
MKTPHLQNATITRRAYAKINTYLEVLRQRTDGYHELCSHMQLISLHDTLQLCMKVEDGEGLSLSLTCDNAMLSCGEDNLILKAARAYFSQLTLPQCNLSLHIALQKNIPMQGGLAGGSADAAAALLAINELCGMPMCEQELCDLGARLGADIPFCIRGLQGAQTARGIGERMTAAPGVSEEVTLLVVSPGTAVSTPAAFRLLDERYGDADANAREIENELRYTKHLQALCDGELSRLAQTSFNRFEEAVFALQPETEAVFSLVSSLGADMTRMSGSGPTIVGYFSDETAAIRARDALAQRKIAAYICKTIR